MPVLLIIVNVDWFFYSHRFSIALGALYHGYEVHIATTFSDQKYLNIFKEHGLHVHSLSIDRRGQNPFNLLKNFLRMYNICRAVGPDIVHLVTIQPVLFGGIAAKLAGVNSIVYAISGLGHAFFDQSFAGRFRRYFIQIIYRFSLNVPKRLVIFQNPDDQKLLTSVCKLLHNESVLIPGSGIDLSLFTFKPIFTDTPIVLMASRLLFTKGVSEFIQASEILKSRGFDAIFQLAGSPDFSNPAAVPLALLQDSSEQGLIEVLGQRTDLNDLMSHAHIVCLPSFYPEGLPKVLCEAAACGRVVITTDEPGCRDAIEDRVTGLLVPSCDAVALADAIQYLLCNPDMIKSMGLSGRKRAEKLFDINAIVHKHIAIYESFLSPH